MPDASTRDVVTKLCREIRAQVDAWAHHGEIARACIIPNMNCLTLAEWKIVSDRLGLADNDAI
jgi:hypothetical protein